MAGALFLVATPIGNLGDLSGRAVEILREVDFVICEDTRHSRTLFAHFGINPRTVSLPAFAEKERAAGILDRLEAGERAALVTDAGSPGISDPGEALVAEAVRRGVQVSPVPGPSAVIAALSASGLPTGRFHFAGFLPRQGPERKAILEELAPLRASLVFYESPRRTGETLGDLLEALGNRQACVARELTKVHETFLRGSLGALRDQLAGQEVLGEVAIIVEGRRGEERWTEEELRRALSEGLARGEKLKSLSKELAARAGWTGNEVYRLGLDVQGK